MNERQFDAITAARLTELDPVALALFALERLADVDREGARPSAAGDRAAALLLVSERAQAAAIPALGHFDAERGWGPTGARSAARWVAQSTPLAHADGRGLVAAAAVAREHPVVARALQAGEISIGHARLLGRAARGCRAPLFTRDVEHLVEVASSLTVDAFAKTLAYWEQLADDELAREEAAVRYTRRGVVLARTFDGSSALKGTIEPVTAAFVQRAFDVLVPPDAQDAPGGPRTAAQRAHDALGEMARRVLEAADPAGGNPGVTVTAVVDAELLARYRARRLEQSTEHDPALPDLRHVRCDIDGNPVPVAVIDALLGDAGIRWILTDGRDEPLSLGRARRLFSAAQREALAVQYGTCALDCDVEARRCRFHHIAEWDRDEGATDIANGVPLCWYHHTFVHLNDWRPVRLPDGRITYEPPDPEIPAGLAREGRARPPDWPVAWRPRNWEPPPGGFRPRGSHLDDPTHQCVRDRLDRLVRRTG